MRRYFDCGYGQWVGEGPNNWCSPYIGWQKVYENSPRKLIENFNLTFTPSKVWGGEAALWTEQARLEFCLTLSEENKCRLAF